jgi:2-isopropylmalate synthase
VHAAAIAKAYSKGDHALADTVYSSIPARLVGREQEIEVGPMSGRSNVIFWLQKRGYPVDESLVDAIFARAKQAQTVLAEPELRTMAESQAANKR